MAVGRLGKGVKWMLGGWSWGWKEVLLVVWLVILVGGDEEVMGRGCAWGVDRRRGRSVRPGEGEQGDVGMKEDKGSR